MITDPARLLTMGMPSCIIGVDPIDYERMYIIVYMNIGKCLVYIRK